MNEPTRRDVLVASVAVSVGGVLAEIPLTHDELRVLAMTATPAETWAGREHEYAADPDRVVDPGSRLHRIVLDLEARGLVAVTPTPPDRDWDWTAKATPIGIAALRRAGVEV